MNTTIKMANGEEVEAKILTENFVAVEGKDCVVHRWSGLTVREWDNPKNEWKTYAQELEKITELNWKGTTADEIFGEYKNKEGIVAQKVREASKRATGIVAENKRKRKEKQARDKAENENGWITIEMIPGKNCTCEMPDIKAKQVTKHFAINSIAGDYDLSRLKAVTHIPTGLRIKGCLNVPDSKKLAKELETLPIDWGKTSFTKEDQRLYVATIAKYSEGAV